MSEFLCRFPCVPPFFGQLLGRVTFHRLAGYALNHNPLFSVKLVLFQSQRGMISTSLVWFLLGVVVLHKFDGLMIMSLISLQLCSLVVVDITILSNIAGLFRTAWWKRLWVGP